MSETKLQNIILWVAKIATLIISAPATLSLVDGIYKEQNLKVGFFDFVWVVQLAALIVVEGAFLYSWQKVQDHKNLVNKEETEQNVYVGAAWFTYFILLAVGLMHHEGAAALILRAAMGVLLYIATNDKLAALRRKVQKDTASGKRESKKVIRAKIKAEEDVAIALIKKQKEQQILAIESSQILLEKVSTALIANKIRLLGSGDVVEGIVVEQSILEEQQNNTKDFVGENGEGTDTTNDQQNTTKDFVLQYTDVSSEQRTFVDEQNNTKDFVGHSAVQQNQFVVSSSDCYVVFQRGEDFVVECRQCDYRELKLAASGKNPRLSATRAGARHCSTHVSEEDKLSRKKNKQNKTNVKQNKRKSDTTGASDLTFSK